MKITVLTRESRSMARRKWFRNMDPLAPVVATVRFSGAVGDKVGAPSVIQVEASKVAAPKLRIGTRERQVKAAPGD